MTEIHIVDRSNIADYRAIMDAYHVKRHEIFVEERGWMTLQRDDGRERDEYDDEHAVYLLAIDHGKLVGGQRLYPTLRPHMLSETFADLCDRPLPRNAVTMEWTRYFVVKERRLGRTDCRLLASVQQYCLEEGIAALTAVVEVWWLPRWQQAGFSVRPLGLPRIIEGQPTLAVCIEVSEQSLACVSRLGGLRPATLARHGASRLVAAQTQRAA